MLRLRWDLLDQEPGRIRGHAGRQDGVGDRDGRRGRVRRRPLLPDAHRRWARAHPRRHPDPPPGRDPGQHGQRGGAVNTGDLIWTDGAGGPQFSKNAKTAVNDSQLRRNVRKATTTISERRAGLVAETPDWQQLRQSGAAIKDHVLNHLDAYLEQFELGATERGAQVHWARDAAEANQIVTDLVRQTGDTEVIKVKSMATQEIGLVEALKAQGITAHEPDMAKM